MSFQTYDKDKIDEKLATCVEQCETMPAAEASLVGKIVQFKGTTIAGFINGYFYKCIESTTVSGTYEWKNIQVQDSSGGSCPYAIGDTKVQYTSLDNPNDLYPTTTWDDITATVAGKYIQFDDVKPVGTDVSESLPTPAITLDTKGSHGHAIFSAGAHTHGIRGWKNVCKDSNDVKVVSLDYISSDSPRYTDSAGAHTHTTSADGDHTHTATVDTSGVYGVGSKVQPASITTKLWQRTA